jgi:hypothetical protein
MYCCEPRIVIYEPSAGRRCSRMSAFFNARATKERVPLNNARISGRCLWIWLGMGQHSFAMWLKGKKCPSIPVFQGRE